MNKEEYLSRLTKRIPLEKFKIVDISRGEIPPVGRWYQIIPSSDAIYYGLGEYTEGIPEFNISIYLGVNNPPIISDEIVFIQGGGGVSEIPDEVAEKSLRALYLNILPYVIAGILGAGLVATLIYKK